MHPSRPIAPALFVAAFLIAGCGTRSGNAYLPQPAPLVQRATSATSQTLYVSYKTGGSGKGSVVAYDTATGAMLRTIGISMPTCLTTDTKGSLYVCNGAQKGAVTEFLANQRSAARKLTYGSYFPSAVVTDAKDNVYVFWVYETTGIGELIEYPPSGTKSSRHISFAHISSGWQPLAIDKSGNVYVDTTDSPNGVVRVFGPRGTKPKLTITNGLAMAVEAQALDASGNLYVGSGSQSSAIVGVYAPGKSSPKKIIKTSNGGWPLAIDASNNLYVGFHPGGASSYGFVAVYKGSTLLRKLSTTRVTSPRGLAFDAQGNLYVENYQNSVTMYAAGTSKLLRKFGSFSGYPEAIALTP